MTAMFASDGRTVDEWEQHVGEQFLRARQSEELDQATLARLASVSKGALGRLERGEGSTLRVIIRVAKALGRTDWLDGLFNIEQISPIEALRMQRRLERQKRQRVRHPRPKPVEPEQE
ncbi:helix-turn-helix domain-containing protein [Diaminobutyricibacter sp. McL0618]|uniref:helix-turn-helix domain-containing protein n=1 Tax=Leifsonia sp. McL0618 TaxID=3415677 RepID=UPI003CE74187